MSKSLCLKVLRYTKYFVELCKGTGRICESDLSAPKTLTDTDRPREPVHSHVFTVFTALGRTQQFWDVQEGLRMPRKLCATPGLRSRYERRSECVAQPRFDNCQDRPAGSPSIFRLFRLRKFDEHLGRMRPSQGHR